MQVVLPSPARRGASIEMNVYPHLLRLLEQSRFSLEELCVHHAALECLM
jgi:hypothetical protein